MTSTQKYIMIACIITNLIVGNLFLLIERKERIEYLLLISASIASVLCFLFLFIKIRPVTRNVFLLWLLSLITCIAVCILGTFIMQIGLGKGFFDDFPKILFVGLFMSLVGVLIYSPFIILLSFVNLIWLLLFVKSPSWGDKHTDD